MSSSGGTNQNGYGGQLTPENSAGSFNSLHFIINWLLSETRTVIPVKVLAVANAGEVSPVGYIDVQPMVNQIDGISIVTPHGTVNNVPYFRLQGGSNAVIIDPEVGDIGLMLCADRDISAVKSSKAVAPPGSARRFDFADGLYVGGFLNGTPEQYVQFNSNGMTINDKNGNMIVMSSTGISINGVLFDRSANVSGAGTVQATGEGTFGGHTVGAHHHGGVQTGSSNTLGPTG